MKFSEFGLSPTVVETLTELGITEATEIQNQSIKPILEGKDVIGESATGSGKTFAFGCGIVEHTKPGQGLQALVLAPTRELAEQVRRSLEQLSKRMKLRVCSIYGGVGMDPQVRDLQRCEVVVATPGRFLDHMRNKTVDLSKITTLVLDEADRMSDMGFIDDVEIIIKACPKDRQTLFFTATLSHDVKGIAQRYMKNPIKAKAQTNVDPSKLTQVYYDVSRNMKIGLLVHLLRQERSGLIIVFCNTRGATDFVAKNLQINKINATPIHGGLSQNKRTKTITSFTDARVDVLVCTDVAARGLHIPDVSHVYNYDLPKDVKSYVHRIGRTARAGKEGKAVNLLSQEDYDNFDRILREYSHFNIQKVELPRFERVIISKPQVRGHGGRRPFRRGPRR